MFEIMLPLLSGMLTLGLIIGNQRISVGFALALGYALGMGILGQLMLLIGWHEISLNKDSVCLALFIYTSIISLLFLFRLYYVPHKSIDFLKNHQAPWSWKHKLFFVVLLGYVLYQIGFIFWNGFFVPIYQADAFSVHAYRAKVFFYTHYLNLPSEGHYLIYPMQVPLDMAWVAFNIGQWQEGWAKMIFPFNCVAFIIIIYNFMKYWTDRLTSLLTIALMVSSLFFVLHASIAYCDFTIMFYTMGSLVLMGWGIATRYSSLILLGGLMAAFATQVKFQGIEYWIFGIIILCRFILTKEFFNFRFALKALAGFMLPFIIVEVNFILFKTHDKITEMWNQEHYFVFSLHGLLHRMGYMSLILLDNLFLSGNWNLLWFFLIVVLLLSWKQKKPLMVRFFSFVLAMFFVRCFLYAIFTKSFFYLARYNIDNLSRFLLHFYPLCPVLIGLLIYHFLKNRRIQGAPRPLDLL